MYCLAKCIVKKFNALITLLGLLLKKINAMIKAMDYGRTKLRQINCYNKSNRPKFEKFNATIK